MKGDNDKKKIHDKPKNSLVGQTKVRKKKRGCDNYSRVTSPLGTIDQFGECVCVVERLPRLVRSGKVSKSPKKGRNERRGNGEVETQDEVLPKATWVEPQGLTNLKARYDVIRHAATEMVNFRVLPPSETVII